MIIRDFKTQYQTIKPISNDFIDLMQKTFGLYSNLCSEFFANLAEQVQSGGLDLFLNDYIRKKLFNPEICLSLEGNKKRFLAESIKIEEFIKESDFNFDFLIDLEALKRGADQIYELFQKHWELYKYQDKVDKQSLINFILDIDNIAIGWDSYLEKYLTIGKLLEMTEADSGKKNYTTIEAKYHMPETENFSLDELNTLLQFFQQLYAFVVKIVGPLEKKDKKTLEITSLEVVNPVSCSLLIPDKYADSMKQLLRYLSIDVIKRETLFKYAMEVMRIQNDQKAPKASVTTFHKKLSKLLDSLKVDGYLSVDSNEDEDSVQILKDLCREMERLKVKYDSLLVSSATVLARSRIRNPGKKEEILNDEVKKTESVKKQETSKSEKKELEKKDLDLEKKEHIAFLTC